MKLKRGDTVKILIGKDKGKTGKVERFYPVSSKVLVEGINKFKRHIKSRTKDQKSEIVEITKPLSISNVVMVCPNCKKTAKIGYKMSTKGGSVSGGEKNTKIRVCRKCGKNID